MTPIMKGYGLKGTVVICGFKKEIDWTFFLSLVVRRIQVKSNQISWILRSELCNVTNWLPLPARQRTTFNM